MNDIKLAIGQAGMILDWRWDWIDVKDRLPMESEYVLTYEPTNTAMPIKVNCIHNDNDINSWEYGNSKIITHWMPLPSRPDEVKSSNID